MTAIVKNAGLGPRRVAAEAGETERFAVAEIWWGYVVRSTEGPSPLLVLLQAVASLLGAAAAAAAVGLWALGSAPGLMAMKLGASVVLGSIAALLLWFASRGERAEFHVDTSLGEVREVVRNRAGRPTLLSRQGFATLTAVELVPAGLWRGIGLSWLVLTTAAGDEVTLVRGAEPDLRRLAERLSRDIERGSRKAAHYEAVYPIERGQTADGR